MAYKSWRIPYCRWGLANGIQKTRQTTRCAPPARTDARFIEARPPLHRRRWVRADLTIWRLRVPVSESQGGACQAWTQGALVE